MERKSVSEMCVSENVIVYVISMRVFKTIEVRSESETSVVD